MAAGVRTCLPCAGTASNHRAGRSGDFWRRQRLLRDVPAWRLQREGPTRTEFPPASARMAPGVSVPLEADRAVENLELVINLKTAKVARLGLCPSLYWRADDLIE